MLITSSSCVLNDFKLQALLHEDSAYGDLTTAALGITQRQGQMEFRARMAMMPCAIEEAARLLALAGCDNVSIQQPSGKPATPSTLLLTATGTAGALHLGWKPAQNLIESVSGISTAVQNMVAAIADSEHQPVIACTRKHFPGTRAIIAKAVSIGGGVMHRLGLAETVLVFAEHRVFLNSAEKQDYIKKLHHQLPEKKIVVEVATIEEALAVLPLAPDVLQLEKFSPVAVAKIVAASHQIPGQPTLIAAAGGIHQGNVADYAATGAKILVTSAPYFAPPRDVQVNMSLN
jgi:molybdenum transport protein